MKEHTRSRPSGREVVPLAGSPTASPVDEAVAELDYNERWDPVEFHGLPQEREHDLVFNALDDTISRGILVLLARYGRMTVEDIAVELDVDNDAVEASLRHQLAAGLVARLAATDADDFAVDADAIDAVAERLTAISTSATTGP